MKSLACATALTLCSMAALAQDGMAAKSLFFGSDGSVMSVPTTAQGAAAVANAPKAAASGTKVASATPKKPAGLGAGYFIRLKKPDGSTQVHESAPFRPAAIVCPFVRSRSRYVGTGLYVDSLSLPDGTGRQVAAVVNQVLNAPSQLTSTR